MRGNFFMSNILDIPLPRERIRLAFSRILTIYFALFHLVLGVVGVGGTLLTSGMILVSLAQGEWPPSADWIMWCITLGLLLFFCFWARDFFARILPGRIRIVAVRIVRQPNPTGWKGYIPKGQYGFSGATIARIIRQLPAIAPPATLVFLRCEFQRINFTNFGRKPHKLLYLDERRHIAIAAEKCWRGGAVLLDENLTYLRLNKQDKQQLLASLRKLQKDLARNPERLNKIIKAIPKSRHVKQIQKNTREYKNAKMV